jgi:hypothetical protein
MEHWVFGDGPGDLDFSTKGPRYFVVGTVTAPDATAAKLLGCLDDLS